MKMPILLVVAPVLVMVAALSLYWTMSRSASILYAWAEQQGLEILSKQYCWFFRGPFFWRSSKNQSVYYVRVRDAEGRERTGWVRVGGWFWGLLSDQAEAVWEEGS